MIGVYRIYNTSNDYSYIGSSIDMLTRIKGHFSQLKSRKHTNSDFQKDFDLHGIESFKVSHLVTCKTDKGLIEKEQYFIEIFDNLYNKRSSEIGSKSRGQIKKEQTTIKLEPEMIQWLKKEAKRRNRSVTNLIETWIKEKLDLL